MEHFITTADFSADELDELIDRAGRMKRGEEAPTVAGKNLILLFFNPSLRTRTSFEFAMQQLGGNTVTLNTGGDTWKLEDREGVVMDGEAAEHITDAARVLGRYADAIGIRVFAAGESWEKDRKDPVLGAFVREAGVPVVNMESSLYHPNQALGDIMTVKEHFGRDIRGLPITITWANHPNPLPMAVANSILLISCRFGMDVRLVRPEGYDLDETVMDRAKELLKESKGSIRVTDNINEGFKGSRVVYAKSWGSIRFYGDKKREREHRKSLDGWIVDDEKMALTDGGVFMHCLPVRRNVVVTDSVIDGKSSIVYDEAENRLHAQKAVLCRLLGG
ncbi:MAG: N-acetylornithine carbamoyltransferase [Spirochaetes bacterium]|nr:N-acetylornithine carbamoyltransferase [Spirochaetota bacterium]